VAVVSTTPPPTPSDAIGDDDETPGASGHTSVEGSGWNVRGWGDPWWWAAGVIVAFGRWLEAADRHVFHIAPDEPAQLAMARWLSGGTRWNMFDHLTYRPGYAVVVAPLAGLFGGGEALVRAALTLNAVIAGLAAMILARLVARWTDLGPRGCAAVAAIVALAPLAISSSAYAWAEPLITLSFLATVLAIDHHIEDRLLTSALVAVVVASFTMTVHGRMLPVLPVTAVLCAGFLLRDRRWSAAAGVLGLAAALGIASLEFTDWLQHAVWDAPSDANTADTIISRLDAPVALLDSLAGQTWYQLVSSLGLVGLGAAVAIVAVVRPTGALGRWQAVSLIALITPLALTSVAFMSDRDRPDQLVYGRYVDSVVWPLMALGLAWAVRRLRPTRATNRSIAPLVVGLVMVGTGVIVAVRHGDLLADGVGLRMMIPGLLPYIGSNDAIPVVTITVVAAVAVSALAVVGLVRHDRKVPIVPMVVAGVALVAWSGLRVHDAQTTFLDAWAIGEDVAEIDAIVPAGDRIGVVMVRDTTTPSYTVQRQRFQVYQLFLPDHEFVWERSAGTFSTRYVLAPSRVDSLRDAGGTVRWRDPAKPMALWELPAPSSPATSSTTG
jgi:hypothetical protein